MRAPRPGGAPGGRQWRATAAIAVVLAAALLVGWPPAGQAKTGANPRAPWATAGQVRDVQASAVGRFLAVTDDPGSSLPSPGNPGAGVPTWYVWAQNGTLVASGTSDMDSCGARVGDLCQSSAVSGSISRDGTRIAVGATIALSPVDMGQGLLVVRDLPSGTGAKQAFTQPIQFVAMAADGSAVGVVERIPPTAPNGAPTSRVSLFTIDGATLHQVVAPYIINAPANALAISPDGARLAVAADHTYLFAAGSNTPSTESTIGGPMTAVAIAGAPLYRVLAGSSSGSLVLLEQPTGVTPVLTLNVNSAIGGIATNGTVAFIGDAAGKAYLFDVLDSTPHLRPRASRAVAPDAVKGLALSADGHYALLRSQTQVHLLQTATANVTDLWSFTPPGAPVGGGVQEGGDVAAAGSGSSVVAFDASHAVAVTVPDAIQAPPRVTRDVDLPVRNDGNRNEHVTLGAWFPQQFFATLDATEFNLTIGQTVTVHAHVVVGADLPPGANTLYFNATLDSGPVVPVPVRFDVLPRDAVALDVDGPAAVPLHRGETATFVIRVSNHGNTHVTGSPQGTLDNKAWTLHVPPLTFSLDPGAGDHFNVTLTAPSDAKDGDTATVELQLAGRPASQVTLTGVVGARFQPLVKAPGLVNVAAGADGNLAVEVQNTGNVADAYAITVTGAPDSWGAHVAEPATGTTGPLEPGATTTVSIQIHPPTDAVGATVTLTLHAASTAEPGATSSDEILVRVGMAATSEPGHGTPLPSGLAIIALALASLLAARRLPAR